MWQAALNADFGGSQLPSFFGFAPHVFDGMEIGVSLTRPATEGAELAADETDVGEIDIAIHYIGDDVADQVAAKGAGGNEQGEQISILAGSIVATRTIAIRESVALFVSQARSILCFENTLQRGANRLRSAGRNLFPAQRWELLEFGSVGHVVLLIECYRKRSFCAGRISSRPVPLPWRYV